MNDTITVAVQCALAKETKPFLEQIGDASHERHGGVDVGVGTYRGIRLVVGEGGMGSVSAGAASQMLIDRYAPDVLVFSGIAGGLNPALRVGDIVVGDQLHYLETNTPIIAECAPWKESFTSDETLRDAALDVLERQGWGRVPSLRELAMGQDDTSASAISLEDVARRFVCGTIATSNQFNTDPDVLERIKATVHADCEEMEGTAAAHICAKNDVPFLAIRAISNQCGESYESLDDHQNDLVDAAQTAASVGLGVIDMLVERRINLGH
ncbi:5'-methylthioadenosine/S-adenosylhomocysteine nucleosidase [Bifidobacterium sp.]|uniref:5'-methylthioadenosine/S-adenosylhomocysteine nucleosidase n=1 Tax=Bifidobacterium sp. TaxID=41200 RepID=UPI003D7DC73D